MTDTKQLREAKERERKVRYVSELITEAKLIYRAAEVLHVDNQELSIEACVKLVTSAAITDALLSVSQAIDAKG